MLREVEGINHKSKCIETTKHRYEYRNKVPEGLPTVEEVELGELPVEEEVVHECPRYDVRVGLLEFNLSLIFLFIYSLNFKPLRFV